MDTGPRAGCLGERIAMEGVSGVARSTSPDTRVMLKVDGRKRGGVMSNEGRVGPVEGNCGDRTGGQGHGAGVDSETGARWEIRAACHFFRHQAQTDGGRLQSTVVFFLFPFFLSIFSFIYLLLFPLKHAFFAGSPIPCIRYLKFPIVPL